jgi:hypothetical protein
MPKESTKPVGKKSTRFEADQRQTDRVLPDGSLGRFLREITPTGSRALQLGLWGVCVELEYYPLPITAPPVGRPDWLRVTLSQLVPKGKTLPLSDIDALVGALQGTVRGDGIPVYAPRVYGPAYRLTDGKGRMNAWVRRIGGAVAVDLGSYPLVEVSAKVLGLHGHAPSRSAGIVLEDHPRLAREYRRLGRWLLAELGVWPWAYAPSGKLPARWRTDETYLVPLRRWFEWSVDEVRGQARQRLMEARHLRTAWGQSTTLIDPGSLRLPPEGNPSGRYIVPLEDRPPAPVPERPTQADLKESEESWDRVEQYERERDLAPFERARSRPRGRAARKTEG